MAVALTVPAACAAPQAQGPAFSGGELTDAERIELERAEEVLTQRCMARHGFPYWPAPPLSAEERRSIGYVLTDVAWARIHGYGGRIERKLLAAKKTNRNIAYRNSLIAPQRTRYDAALRGGRDVKPLSATLPAGGRITSMLGGCGAEAQEGLYGDREEWFRLDKTATNLLPLYVPDLVKDPRFSAAQQAWARCMSRKGHPYTEPPEVRATLPRLTRGLSSEKSHSLEVELAVTEATCARTSSLADTARSLQAHYRERAGRPYARDLAEHRRLERAALDRARRITR
ncbi:hypothetical protein [Nonomuraea sp. LPB2021202275-12-8]|uniref:hypothetical protein n=1 Tax=Nonomuraea sp. LPB2021202275-12-8 TaxID=3120159 RepID=UPI00300D0831